jgi:hypothetical protein
MKFISEPNQLVKDHRTGKPLLRFNSKGEYETEDEKLIQRMQKRFKIRKRGYRNGQ